MKQTKYNETEVGMVPEDWEETVLGDKIELCYGKSLPREKRAGGIIPVYGSNGITGSHSVSLVKGPGIIVGRKGSVGEVVFSEKDFWPIDTTYFVRLRSKGDLRFWYYLLNTINLNKMNSHSAVPGLNRDVVYALTARVPEAAEQKSIAKVLSDLDAKIELNQQMNKTLESIGQALFKRWFVDFEFPDENGSPYKSSGGEMVDSELGKIPKGWEVKPIDEIATFLNGLALQKYPAKNDNYLPVIKIRELKQGITDCCDKASRDIPKEYLIQDGDLLFSWSGSLEVVFWMFGEGALNQHLFKVTSEKYPKWFYYYWIKHYLPQYRHIAKGKATTMGHIQRKHLTESLVSVPPSGCLGEMTVVLFPLIEKIINLGIETQGLSQIRDSLLPRLMSGRIRVEVGS